MHSMLQYKCHTNVIATCKGPDSSFLVHYLCWLATRLGLTEVTDKEHITIKIKFKKNQFTNVKL